jgi:hypothetical protein
MQKDAFARVKQTSEAFHELERQASDTVKTPHLLYKLEEARWHLLRAETSCNFYWGEEWVDRCHRDLDMTWLNIDETRPLL